MTTKYETTGTVRVIVRGDCVRWYPNGSRTTRPIMAVAVRTERDPGGARGFIDLWLGREHYEKTTDSMVPYIFSKPAEHCEYIETPVCGDDENGNGTSNHNPVPDTKG